MFSYLTKEDLLRQKFTHHGRYYGLPIWIGDHGDDKQFMIAPKYKFTGKIMHLMMGADEIIQFFTRPGEEYSLKFFIGREIDYAKL